MADNLLDGVRSRDVATERLRMRVLEAGPEDGVPVVMVHGNLATGRFFEHLLPGAPPRYRFVVPDMRGFGNTERLPIDGSRGLRDWSDDTASLVAALGHRAARAPRRLVHRRRRDRAVPPGPAGGGRLADAARPCLALRLRRHEGGRDAVRPRLGGQRRRRGQPRLRQAVAGGRPYGRRPALATQRDEQLVLVEQPPRAARPRGPAGRGDPASEIGDDGYPGDSVASEHWPGFAPGTRGILNALSGSTAPGTASSRSRPSRRSCGRTATPTS